MKFTAITLSALITSVTATTIRKREGRKLQTGTAVEGPCTVENFNAAGVTSAQLTTALGNPADLQAALTAACAEAAEPTIDWYNVIHKGRQFDKNFMDGETDWNEMFNEDSPIEDIALLVDHVYDEVSGVDPAVLHFPGDDYLTNFNNCAMNSATCCYVANRDGGDPEDISDICVIENWKNPRTTHIASGGHFSPYTVYMANDDDAAFCQGFAWDDAEDSFSNLVKGNTLFWMAFKDGLVDKQYVRPPPGSPMCGCTELMPKVSHTDCVEAKEKYIFDGSEIKLDLSFGSCTEDSLASHMKTLSDEGTVSAAAADVAAWRTETSCDIQTSEYLAEKGWGPKPE